VWQDTYEETSWSNHGCCHRFRNSAGYNILQYKNIGQLYEANEDFQALFASVFTLDNGNHNPATHCHWHR